MAISENGEVKDVPHHQHTSKALGCLILLIFTTLGCIFGIGVYDQDASSNDNIWRELGTPPEPVTALLAIRTETVYVETTSGTIYSCYYASPYDHSCWIKTDAIPPDRLVGCPRTIDSWAPPEPEDVVQRMSWFHCGGSPIDDRLIEFSYLLLADGTVLQWFSETFTLFLPPNEFRHFLTRVGGITLIGLSCGLLMMRYLHQRVKNR